MNILYIGPYRQNNLTGLTSLLILLNLLQNKKYKVTSRPIYYDAISNDYINNDLPQEINHIENSVLDSYDVIIQHSPVSIASKIDSIGTNIIIPILDDRVLSADEVDLLNSFDKILVDNKTTYNLCQKYYAKIKNKIITYDYDLLLGRLELKQFDIRPFISTQKLYFIGNYNNNINNIYNLCHAFIKHASQTTNEYSLIFYLLNIDPQTKNIIEKNINDIYQMYNMPYSINRIIIAPIKCTIDNLLTAHNTCDIFIDLQDDLTHSLNTKFATALTKKIINFSSDDYNYEFVRNNKISSQRRYGVSCSSIDLKIHKVITTNHTDPNIPFKKQHIKNII